MGLRPDCDCATQQIGIDPCMGSQSCECYCTQKKYYQQACPGL